MVDFVADILSANKATGLDEIPMKFIKDGSGVLAEPIAHLINLSLHSGVVPDELKLARIVHIHKKGCLTDPSNYRPISILSCLSKIFESVVHRQLLHYLEGKNIIFENQSGFRSGFSTETTLTDLTDRIKESMDKGLYTGMILLDLKKAFDTVNFEILMYKLEAIGLDDSVCKWFKSYL